MHTYFTREKIFPVVACVLLIPGLLLLGAPTARAQMSLGVSGECAAAIGGDEAVRRLGTILTEQLGEEVVLRVFPDGGCLVKWMEHYRMVDLGLMSRDMAGRQPAGRFLVVGQWPAGDSLFLMRPDISDKRRAAVQQVVETVLPGEEHRRAVDLARQGQLNEALRILKGLSAAKPDDLRIAYDLLVILGWAERDEEAVALTEKLPLAEAPAYVVEAAGKSLRNTRRFDAAATLYSQARTRFPENSALAVGQVYALADGEHPEKAGDLAESLRREFADEPTVPEAGSYVAKRRGDQLALLDWSQRLLDLVPDHAEALRNRKIALDGLGAGHLAVDQAEKTPQLWSREELLQLRANRAAHQVRWGALEPPDEAARFAETDRALAMLEENLAALDPNDPDDASLILQTRQDRLVALRDRVRMDEVVTEYRRLVAEGVAIPDFALQAVADAQLYLRQPEAARDLYLHLLETNPKDFTLRLNLVYTYIELEDFTGAQSLVDRLAAEQPVWLYENGNRTPNANHKRLDADVTAIRVRRFGDDLKEAQSRIETMHALAPRNPELVCESGNVQASRGRPRCAQEIYRQGLAIAPDDFGLQAGMADTHFDLNEFPEAQRSSADLYRRYPENRQAQRLQRRWDIHNMREFRAEAAWADNSGGEPSSRELRLSGTLFSAPFLTNYRAFISDFWSRAEFPEGRGIYQRYGAGLEYRGRDLDGILEISANHSTGNDLGMTLAGRRQLDDHWSLPAKFQLFSSDTPLRALHNGIDADAASLGVDYRHSESRSLGLGGQVMDFSDGNRRNRLTGYLRQRLATRPHYKLDGQLDLGFSTNSSGDGPYFSPEQDFSAELTLENRRLLYRRYSLSFGHRLAPSGGYYWQKNFGGYPVASITYEHNWQAYDRFSLDYGAIWRRRVYDGRGETGMEYFLRLGWRF